MKKIFTFLATVLVFLSLQSVAQSSTICNATFTFLISQNYVSFTPGVNTDSAMIKHTWNFGDSSTPVSSYYASHAYKAPGTYIVTQYVVKTGTNNLIYCSDSSKQEVTILPCKILTVFSYNKDSLLSNNIHFYTQPTTPGTNVYFNWNFGDGDTSQSTQMNPVHTYLKAGTFTVCLYVSNGSFCKGDTCMPIQVQLPITACNNSPYFIVNVDTAIYNEIHITNYSTPAIATSDSISWNFGDSTTSSSRDLNLVHTYSKAGTYNICLFVRKQATDSTVTCSKVICKTITISAPPPVCTIVSNYTWLKDSTNNLTINFTNTSTGLISSDSIRWSFGDNTPLVSTFNASHVYAQAGKYQVCLRIAQGNTCVKYQCDSITVAAPVVNCEYVPNYTWVKDSTNNLKINFTNTSTGLASTDSIKWSFGDGTPLATSFNASHVYLQSGKYQVCLRIARGNTCLKYQCDSITVTLPTSVCNFVPSFTWATDSSNSLKINFTNTTPGFTAKVNWFFGDSSNAAATTTWSASHIYSKPGKYYVCVRMQNYYDSTCYKYQCDSITVTAPTPTCTIVPNYSWIKDSTNNLKINFSNTSTGLISSDSIRWSFGDNTPLVSTFNASHVYAQAGKYQVCLRIAQGNTCVKYQCDSITVTAPVVNCEYVPNYTWVKDSTNNLKINFTNTSTGLASTDSIKWSFGDNTPLVSTFNASHIYAQAGKYQVCLRIARGNTCLKYQCDSITVTLPTSVCNFVPSFTWATDSSNSLKINFTNTTPGFTAKVNWFFGDSSNAATTTTWSASHIYSKPGKYYVCVRMQNYYDSTCYKYQCDSITVNAPTTVCNFVPAFTFAPDSVKALTINFTNTSIVSTSNTVVNWNFGDGASATSWNASHTYTNAGKYYVCLRVQSGTNCIKYQCDSITVAAPVIKADCNQLSLFKIVPSTSDNLHLYFVPLYGGSNVEYTWTYGDGSGSHDSISTYTFAKTGIYNVCLTAFKNTNCASTTCTSVRVDANVNCDTVTLSYNLRRNTLMQNEIYLSASSNAPIMQQTWTISKVNTTGGYTPVVLNQNNPVYDFSDTGYYQICLTASYAGGCTKQYCNTVRIEGIPSICELQAYPNPAQIQVWTYVSLTQPQTIQTYLYNVQDIMLHETTQQGVIGTNTVQLDVENLVAGFYILRIVYGNQICYAKFQKL